MVNGRHLGDFRGGRDSQGHCSGRAGGHEPGGIGKERAVSRVVGSPRALGNLRRRSFPAATSSNGPCHGDTVRTALDRGSGSVTSLVLFGAVVLLGLGGLGGAAVILRVTDTIRAAELAASTVATRALAGDPTPCEPATRGQESCAVTNEVATVRVFRDGVSATAIAGPDR